MIYYFVVITDVRVEGLFGPEEGRAPAEGQNMTHLALQNWVSLEVVG